MPHPRHLIQSAAILILLSIALPTRAADPIVPIAQAVGKTGVVMVTVNEHSPLSTPAVMAQRWIIPASKNAKDEKISIDYDMTQPLYEYIPAAPADDGAYGLLVGACFPSHQFAPEGWKPILEKYHLIWIGVSGENLSDFQNAAKLLDAAHAVASHWKVDPLRTYLAVSDGLKFPGGMPLYFPDVFSGSIYFNVGGWYTKLKGIQTKVLWDSDNWPRPAAASMQLARQRSRVFIGYRGEEAPAQQAAAHDKTVHPRRQESFNDVVIHHGFREAGISLATAVAVDPQLLHDWSVQDGAWFDQAVRYLDAPVPQLRGTIHPGAAATSTTQSTVAPSMDTSAVRAQRTLSMAKNYIDSKLYDQARTRLREIIAEYPQTPAANDARKLLTAIDGK
jgi:hypothetical protein